MPVNEEGFFAYHSRVSPDQYVEEQQSKHDSFGIITGNTFWADVFIVADNQFRNDSIGPEKLQQIIAFANDVEVLLIPKLTDRELQEYIHGIWDTAWLEELHDTSKLKTLLQKPLPARNELLELLRIKKSEKMKKRFGIDI